MDRASTYKPEDFEQIEAYLEGKLSPEEKDEFEARMEREPDFAREVALHREIQIQLGNSQFNAVRETLKQVDRETRAQAKVQPLFRKYGSWIVGIAATVLILLAVWLRTPGEDIHSGRLAMDNFEPYPMLMASRGEPGTDSLRAQAIAAYQNRDFESAAQLFSDYHTSGDQFYAGISLLAQKDFSSAQEILLQVMRSGDSRWQEQARWYAALASLGARDEAQAVGLFLEIKPGQFQYEQAKALLEKLNTQD